MSEIDAEWVVENNLYRLQIYDGIITLATIKKVRDKEFKVYFGDDKDDYGWLDAENLEQAKLEVIEMIIEKHTNEIDYCRDVIERLNQM